MSSFRTPVGPQPASVYWRRRILVGLIAVAVVVTIVLIVFRPGGGGATDPDAPPPTTPGETSEPDDVIDDSADDDEPTTAAEGETCLPEQVEIVAVTDLVGYAPEQNPELSMEITNIGSVACSYDVGTGAQEYIITSGDDRIWSSADCQTDPTESVQSLPAGETLSTQPFAWDRTRSSADSCGSERPGVIGGGASYHLVVRLGESFSGDSRQFVLQ